MSLYVGRGAYCGIGAESTWGTAVTRTIFHHLVSESVRRNVTKVRRPHLGFGTAPVSRSHFTSEDTAAGDVEIECYYEGMGLWLKNAFGTSSSTGAGPYTHTYGISADLPTGLTWERVLGVDASTATARAEVFEGGRITNMRLRCAAGEVMRATFGMIFETSSTRTSATSPTYSSNDLPVLFSHAGALTFNSVSYSTVKSIDFSIDNKLENRVRLGSTNTKQQIRSDFMECKLRVTADLEDDNLITAYTADTQGDVSIGFTSGSTSFTITLHNGFLTDYSDSTNAAGVIERTFEFTGEYDGTDAGAQIVIVNSQSTAVAA